MSSVWWWLRSIQLVLTVALQYFLTPSSTKRYLIWISINLFTIPNFLKKLLSPVIGRLNSGNKNRRDFFVWAFFISRNWNWLSDWWRILGYTILKSCKKSDPLRGLCLYAWVFYTRKNWNFGLNSGALNFIPGLRHQKRRNELEGEFSDYFQNALSTQSVTVKFIFTIFSIKVNNKKPVFWY